MKNRRSFYKITYILASILFLFIVGDGMFSKTAFCRGGLPFEIEKERKLGERFKYELEKYLELVKDYSIQNYIDRIGENITSQVDHSPFDFNFYVYNAPDPNAFAIPAGYIYISTGLLTLAESESELAGVMSHEIAHVTARHIAQKIEREKKINLGTMAAILAGVFLGGSGEAATAVGAFSIAAAQTLSLKYSRENEKEADQLGLDYLMRAGYNGFGMVSFLNKLKRYRLQAFQVPSYLLTHPETENRIDYLDAVLTRLPEHEESKSGLNRLRCVQARVIVHTWASQSAVDYFESGLRTNGEQTELIFGLALANQKIGYYKKSIEGFQKVLALSPGDSDILRDLGISYFSDGKANEAINVLQRSVATNERDSYAFYYLGRAYQEKGNFKKAIESFQIVKKLDKDNADVYYNLGVAYGKEELLADSHRNFGIFFEHKGRLDSALFHFKKALEYYSKDTKEGKEVLEEVDRIKKKAR